MPSTTYWGWVNCAGGWGFWGIRGLLGARRGRCVRLQIGGNCAGGSGFWGFGGCWPPVGVTAPDYRIWGGRLVEMVVFFAGWGRVGGGEDVV